LKKFIFLYFLFFAASLFSNDLFNDFINEQIKVEAKFLDQNLSLEKKMEIKEKQEQEYQKFFMQYASKKKQELQKPDPYRYMINKLKLRMKSNRYQGNTNAAMRDELLLQGYKLRRAIRQAFHDILRYADSNSKEFFSDKISEILLKHFTSHKSLELKKYVSKDQNQSSPVVESLHKALRELVSLKSVANTFSAEIVENSSLIYRTVSLSKSKLFSLINNINNSSYGQQINSYLIPLHLDFAKVLLALAIIFFIIFSQLIIHFLINRFLYHYNLKEEDIEYIHTRITRIFNILASLFILHLIIVVYFGFDMKSIGVSRIFGILYVILIALLLYRITNTLASMKIEHIQSSKILRKEVINLAIKVINTLIMLAAIIAILKIAGVDLTALLSGLGIGGFALAFAAKDSIANIFGSISILAGDLFEQGDWIETKNVDGTVVEIGLRGTTIRTFDNALISIPNFQLANNGIKNWSRRSIGRRIKMKIALTYESDFNDIRQAISDIRSMLKEHPGIANERTQYNNSYRHAKLVSTEDFKGIKRTSLVYMDEFADSSINILLYCFTRSVDWNEWLEVKEDVMYKIADIIKKNHLEFAYPTMTIHQIKEENDKP